MAITKKDLQNEIDILNKKYCKKSKHELILSGAYGGYKVEMRGKKRKDGKGYRGMGSGTSDITRGFCSPRETLTALIAAEVNGSVKERVSFLDKKFSTKRNKNGG